MFNGDQKSSRYGDELSVSLPRPAGVWITPGFAVRTLTSEQRRLPVYLLIEASGALGSDYTEAISVGISVLCDALRSDARILQVDVSVLAFGSSAKQIVPLTRIEDFVSPLIETAGGVALGEGIRCLSECVARDVYWDASEGLGPDLKPIAIIILQNAPTDDWEPHASVLKREGFVDVVVCLLGQCPRASRFRALSEHLVSVTKFYPEGAEDLFRWLSAVVLQSRGFSA